MVPDVPSPPPGVELPYRATEGFDGLYGLEILELTAELARAQVEVRTRAKAALRPRPRRRVRRDRREPGLAGHGGRRWRAKASLAMGLSNQTSFLRPITEGHIHARGCPQAQGPHDMGLGGRDERRRGSSVRADADDDRGQGPLGRHPGPARSREARSRGSPPMRTRIMRCQASPMSPRGIPDRHQHHGLAARHQRGGRPGRRASGAKPRSGRAGERVP